MIASGTAYQPLRLRYGHGILRRMLGARSRELIRFV
jgi:hypothetical protein